MIPKSCSTWPHSSTQSRQVRAKTLPLAALVIGMLALSSAAAQTVYRSVDANGRVTFSDLPQGNASAAQQLGAARDDANQNASLPYALRTVVGKYPVTLYTSTDCAPCDGGRTLLRSRGVPFAEKTISKPEDVASLKRLSNSSSLPLLTVGGHQLKGFSATEWNQYLGFAGYPETSQLPAGYRNPAATPLVALQAVPAPAAPVSAPATPVRAVPTPVAPANPAGIQF